MTNENYTDNIKNAIKAAQNGEMFFIYDSDSREGETDFVITASSVTPDDVRWMRRDGGGLICVAIDSENSQKLGLPFISDVLRDEAKVNPALGDIVERGGDLAYDNRSSFSIWVNHRKTRTGIPDNDRALTINELSNITEKCMKGEEVSFGSEFRTPGHVALLRAADRLVHDRKGQTELSIAIAKMADVTPAMVVCEMLDDSNGRALSKEDARDYAKLHGLVFLEGQEIVDAYEQWEQA